MHHQRNCGTASAYNRASSGGRTARLGEETQPCPGQVAQQPTPWEVEMRWTKPEAEVVAVTMEVTAYVATL
jgi:hypothetical protein